LNWRLGNLDAERCSSKREPCYAGHLVSLKHLMDRVWRPLDGAGLGNRGSSHGDYNRRPTVDTCGVDIAAYTLLPFGQKAVSRADYSGHEDVGTGVLGLLGNVIWLVLAGWWLALAHLITALLLVV